jgi:hypothetical protein
VFLHASHASKLDVTKCETCHAVDGAGAISPPGALGHAPCQSVGCHASWFVATGAKARAKDPALYTKAAAFCLGCHESSDGAPPPAWTVPPTITKRSYQAEREYHVEMNHFEHTKRAACRDCHIVDGKTLALVPDAPGHAQCVQCHNVTKFADFTMAKCSYCHDVPARAEFFPKSRPKNDVRACGGEGHAQLVARKQKVHCFLHERPEHRVRGDGTPVQCGDCHAMVAKGEWNGHRYQSLKDLHGSPVIDNSRDLEHRACGRAGCHAKDVDDSRGTANCQLCHADKSGDIFK